MRAEWIVAGFGLPTLFADLQAGPPEPEWHDSLLLKVALLPVVASTLIAVIAVTLGIARFRPKWAWWIGVGSSVAFAANLGYRVVNGLLAYPDYLIFWLYGRLIREGRNPYAEAEIFFNPFLYPPNELPVFAALSLPPFRLGGHLWTIINGVIGYALVGLTRRVLIARDPSTAESLPPYVTIVLSAAVAFSTASTLTFEEGQISIFIAAMLLLALDAQGRGRPIWAGVWLTIAAVKPTTTTPFLLLFLRKTDRPTWITLVVGTALLCLSSNPISELPARIRAIPPVVAKYGAEGKVNDYSYAARHSETQVGLDHALHRFGLRDRGAIRMGQVIGLVAIGAWLAWTIAWRRSVSPGAAIALVALYSTVFYYHRIYDLVILAIPLTFAVSRARSASGRSRALYVAATVLTLVALYPSGRLLIKVLEVSQGLGTAGRVIQAVVLPVLTVSILGAMACLAMAERRRTIEV